MKAKLYEVECQRNNVSPKAFYEYCRKQALKKGLDLSCWTEYEEWVNPPYPEEYRRCEHSNWDIPAMETMKYMPCDIHLYLERHYNFIMEFEFDTEKKGHGYMYAVEYVRDEQEVVL